MNSTTQQLDPRQELDPRQQLEPSHPRSVNSLTSDVTIFVALFRARMVLPVVAILCAGIVRFIIERQKDYPWHVESVQDALYVSSLIFFGSGLAALAGSELPGATREGWAWLLSRPVSRGRLLLIRASVDLLVLGLSALALVFMLGSFDSEGPNGHPSEGGMSERAFWMVCMMTWVVAHASAAWGASLGLEGVGAVLVGLALGGTVLGSSLGSVGLGFQLSGVDALGIMVHSLGSTFGRLGPGDELPLTDWMVPAVLLLASLFLVLVGWGAAVRAFRIGPRPLSRMREVALVVLGLIATGGAMLHATTRIASNLDTTAGLGESQLLGATAKGDLVLYERSRFGMPRLTQYSSDGTLVWWGTTLNACSRSAAAGSTVVAMCWRTAYTFRDGQVGPTALTVDFANERDALFLSPDGDKWVRRVGPFAYEIGSLDSNEPGVRLPIPREFHPSVGRWFADGTILLVDAEAGSAQWHRASDGAQTARAALQPEGGQNPRYTLLALDAGEVLFQVREEGQTAVRGMRLTADGQVVAAPGLDGPTARWVVGSWGPDARPIFADQKRSQVTTHRFWKYLGAGVIEPLGELYGPGPDSVGLAPDGRGMLYTGMDPEQNETQVIAPILNGKLGDATPVRAALVSALNGETLQPYALSLTEGAIYFPADKRAPLKRLPWPK